MSERKEVKKFTKKEKKVYREKKLKRRHNGLIKSPGFSPSPSQVSSKVTTISDIMAALRPKPTTLPKLLSVYQDSDDESVVVRSEEKKEPVKEQMIPKTSVHALLGLGRRNRRDMHMTFQLFAGTPVTTASGAGSYFPLFTAFTSGNVLWATVIAAVQEFNSLDVLFDEFFISKIVAEWQPRNRYNGSLSNTEVLNSACTVSFFLTIADCIPIRAPLGSACAPQSRVLKRTPRTHGALS